MRDSRKAPLKKGDHVFIEAVITELCEGGDPNFCNVTVKVVTPEQPDSTTMDPPSISAINTKMLTKIGSALVVLLMLAGGLFAQPPQAPKPPQGPPVREVVQPPKIVTPAKSAWLTYIEGLNEAERTGKPVVAFIGITPRKIDGAIVCYADTLADGTSSAIIVSTDGGNHGHWLKASVNDNQIRAKAGLGRIELKASPFQSAKPTTAEPEVPVAVGDDDAPWPVSIVKPAGLLRYKPTQWTQRTFNRGIIQRVQRNVLEEKYQVPGGMAGVVGWRSDLYKMLPQEQESWVGTIDVDNGLENTQREFAHVRAYPEGTIFMDVLSYKGKVFEHRQRTKTDGKWENEVLYRDVAARPPGYAGLKGVQCNSCHSEAGTGKYGVALVSGGDQVLSDPFDALEAKAETRVNGATFGDDGFSMEGRGRMKLVGGRRR